MDSVDNRETILDELSNFERRKPQEISNVLEEYLTKIAKTGNTLFAWSRLKPLVLHKLDLVLTELSQQSSAQDLPQCPNVDKFVYEDMKKKLIEGLDAFSSAPFTIQRLCELLIWPNKHYKRIDKYMRGIEKNVLVVSTVEPALTPSTPVTSSSSQSQASYTTTSSSSQYVEQTTTDYFVPGSNPLVNGIGDVDDADEAMPAVEATYNGGLITPPPDSPASLVGADGYSTAFPSPMGVAAREAAAEAEGEGFEIGEAEGGSDANSSTDDTYAASGSKSQDPPIDERVEVEKIPVSDGFDSTVTDSATVSVASAESVLVASVEPSTSEMAAQSDDFAIADADYARQDSVLVASPAYPNQLQLPDVTRHTEHETDSHRTKPSDEDREGHDSDVSCSLGGGGDDGDDGEDAEERRVDCDDAGGDDGGDNRNFGKEDTVSSSGDDKQSLTDVSDSSTGVAIGDENLNQECSQSTDESAQAAQDREEEETVGQSSDSYSGLEENNGDEDGCREEPAGSDQGDAPSHEGGSCDSSSNFNRLPDLVTQTDTALYPACDVVTASNGQNHNQQFHPASSSSSNGFVSSIPADTYPDLTGGHFVMSSSMGGGCISSSDDAMETGEAASSEVVMDVGEGDPEPMDED